MKNLKKNIRKFIDSFYSVDLECKREIGDVDSWFVLDDQLDNAIIYSGGAGKDITFEINLIQKYNCSVYLFDPSPTGINTVKEFKSSPNLHFSPIGLAGENKNIQFSLPENAQEGSFTILKDQNIIEFPCQKLSDIAKKNNHYYIEILKIDIEGFEYEVLEEIISSEIKVRQICVEYHHFFKEIPKIKTNKSIKLLENNGYVIFHKRNLDFSFYNPLL